MAHHNDFGREAEDRAAAHMEAQGWELLHRNWRWRRRELDLIVRRDCLVAFVEVRARSGTRYGHPAETVDWRKRRDLTAAARAWAQAHGRPGDVYRFDVMAVLPGAPLQHMENAWTL
jgi:putative endonuclease